MTDSVVRTMLDPDDLPRDSKLDLVLDGTTYVLRAADPMQQSADGSWERTVHLPVLSSDEQEKLLRVAPVR